MPMKKVVVILFILLFPAFAFNGRSTGNDTEHKMIITIPEVALLAIHSENTDGAEFNSIAPNIAGGSIQFNQSNQTGNWINYSSVINPNHYRKITATITGEIPPGLILKVNVSECRGKSMGEVGQGHRTVQLSNYPAEIISGIGSGYTGKGVENGHQVLYEIEVNNKDFYNHPQKNNTSVDVVFTLTDDN
jgi:hypothetical protein